MAKITSFGLFGRLLFRTVLIILALTLFFSLMAGMYYKSEPRAIRTAVCDLDHSPLSRALIFSINSSQLYRIEYQAADYNEIKSLIDYGKVDLGLVIPENTYREVMNHRPVNLLTVLNGTANPIVPKLGLGGLKQIVMTLNMQLASHLPVDELGSIPNTRHALKPLLNVNERVFYSPTVNMESSMLPAFMGLAMQIVSMLIVLLALRTNHKQIRGLVPELKLARQMPVKAILMPFITSWLMVGTAISTAFFLTMHIFSIPLPANAWDTVAIIFIFVLSMETLSVLITLNIDNVVALTALITLIVMPAFMYSGYLVPFEQMASFPKWFGGIFPLRYYLHALYLVFNHHLPLSAAGHWLAILGKFIGLFLLLIILSVLIGRIESRGFSINQRKENTKKPVSSEEIS
ncbi:hypothetical protein DRI50_09580 [candidate division KSB1 bacterium]|nr:MAG: hypothetical protein DRI50_09580 [candidate division KSB1 bacterium]